MEITEGNKLIRPELNQQLKAKFFALYLGQNIVYYSGFEESHGVFVNSEFTLGGRMDEGQYLLLRDQKSLSDKENYVIALMAYPDYPDMFNTDSGKNFMGKSSVYSRPLHIACQVGDYLRSIGVALPFMGYSVEDLVLAGWVKLQPVE